MRCRKLFEICFFIVAFFFLAMAVVIAPFRTSYKLLSTKICNVFIENSSLEIYIHRGNRPLTAWHFEIPGIVIDRMSSTFRDAMTGREITDVTVSSWFLGIVGSIAMGLRIIMLFIRKKRDDDVANGFPCAASTNSKK